MLPSSLIMLLLLSGKITLADEVKRTGKIIKGQCGMSEHCDAHCKTTYDLFHSHREIGWALKNEFIAAVYEKHNVAVSAEIGLAHGQLTYELLSKLPSIEHHGIDPFVGGYRQGVQLSIDMEKIMKHRGSEVWTQAIQYKMKDFGCRFQLHHNYSNIAIHDFQPNSLDALFIDGLHTYKGVTTDISLYASRVRKGGIIGFDDYEKTFQGIIIAVDLFVKTNKLTLRYFNPDDKKVVYVIKETDNLDVSMFDDNIHYT